MFTKKWNIWINHKAQDTYVAYHLTVDKKIWTGGVGHIFMAINDYIYILPKIKKKITLHWNFESFVKKETKWYYGQLFDILNCFNLSIDY